MDKKTNRRDFLNKSTKVGALMIVPYYGFSSEHVSELVFTDSKINKDMVIRRTPLTTEDYIAYTKRFTNWGRWGKEDQFGTLNFINEATRRKAVGLVKKGTTISCGRALDTKTADDNPYPVKYDINKPEQSRSWAEGKISVAVDSFWSYLHGFVPTHIDALSHVHTNDGKMYNGHPISDIKSTGALHDSIDIWKDGIISRGVYFDIPKLRNVRCITPDKPVQGWELEDYATKYRIVLQPGDIIIVDCGREKYYEDFPDASRKQGEKPGLDPSVLEFFYKNNSAVLGSDFDEAKFSSVYNCTIPLHAIANPYMGLPTLWNLDLNRLRDKCAELNRNEFLFVINPLIIPGGTSSLVNPVAIF